MRTSEPASSSRRWHQGAPPKSTGMMFGALGGLGFVLPFFGATFLAQWLGDGWTSAILVALIGMCVFFAVVLFVKKRIVEGLLLVLPILGLSLSIWITLTMEW